MAARLPANRWAVEGLANLGALPAMGVAIFVGAPKIRGATGGPSRIVALLEDQRRRLGLLQKAAPCCGKIFSVFRPTYQDRHR